MRKIEFEVNDVEPEFVIMWINAFSLSFTRIDDGKRAPYYSFYVSDVVNMRNIEIGVNDAEPEFVIMRINAFLHVLLA